MAKTEVILLKPVEHLGAESDQVKVAAGYARNYLIPEGLAIPVTAANRRRLEVLKQRRTEREASELTSAKELGRSFEKLVLVIRMKTGDDGKLFGSVTANIIAEELETQFDVSLDRKKIHLHEPIRTLGEHEVDMKLHHDVHATLKVLVESLNPLPVKEGAQAEVQA